MNIFKLNKFGLGLFVATCLILILGVKSFAIDVSISSDTKDKFIVTEVSDFINENNEMYSVLIDKITNDKNIIEGRTVKNSLVKFYINNVEYVLNTDEEGNFILLLEEGLLVNIDQINVRVCDYLENQLYETSFIVHDILPPVNPQFIETITNSDSVIKGFGEPNSSVKIFLNDKEFIGDVHSNGYFEIPVGDDLREVGEIRIISYDSFNNYSDMIECKVVDVIPPNKPNIDVVDCNNNFVYGNGEANCEVIVSFDEKKYKSYINQDGSFYVYDEEGLIENTEFIKVKIVDLSGNVSEEAVFKVQKENVGRIVLKSLDLDSKIIREAIIKVNDLSNGEEVNSDRVFNLDSSGNLFIEELPLGDYEVVIRYRNNECKSKEDILQISLNEENYEVEILID